MDPKAAAITFLDRLFEAEFGFVKSDADGAAAFAGIFDPDAVIHQPAGLPYRGDWRGLDGVLRLKGGKLLDGTPFYYDTAEIQAAISQPRSKRP